MGSGDEETAADLIRGQLGRAAIEEIETLTRDDRTFRRWELLIPDFEVNGRVAPLLTGWALDPGSDRPHMTTAYPRL